MTPVLTFCLDANRYALPIDAVVEVAAMVALAPMPHTPPQILGNVNRHGAVLPMVDMRVIFGVPATPITTDTFFIVTHHAGLVIDTVEQVDYLNALRPAPQSSPFISHVASTSRGLIQLIRLTPLLETNGIIEGS